MDVSGVLADHPERSSEGAEPRLGKLLLLFSCQNYSKIINLCGQFILNTFMSIIICFTIRIVGGEIVIVAHFYPLKFYSTLRKQNLVSNMDRLFINFVLVA